ncbi:SH3 domain-containing protein [Bacillus infantis]|uniref:SH3 domain-containing protein n=1 Tax=Bacillus infantis TaxID=324767 RepID=UPI000B9B058F|nr:SH3 domain-containing protein [Bacillus infantis]MCK6204932.1 SH3 domain-containing protein [Bacillus infantis]OXT18995.1 N-acetylmuramoyl-L-alanine amidase [Bacillus sp. OG2]
MLKSSNILLFLCFILLAGGVWRPSESTAASGGTALIADSGVNIRGGPGLSYSIVKQAAKGDRYPILKESGDWLQLNLGGGSTGWVAGWLAVKEAGKKESASVSSGGTVTADGLRVRSNPGTDASVIAVLNKGQKAGIIEKEGNWVRITGSFGNGWVSADFITEGSSKAEAASAAEGTVTGDSLNVRSAPGTQGTVLGKLQSGDRVSIVSDNGSWTEIIFRGNHAWVSSEFISSSKSLSQNSSAGSSAKPSGRLTGTVTAQTLNLRDTSSLNGKVLGSVSKGETYSIIEEKNNWAKIEYKPGSYGWIAAWYLDKSEVSPANGSKPAKGSTITILHNGTNIRKDASTGSSVLQLANAGESFEVLGREKDWYKISLDGKAGYVAGWIVSLSGSSPQIEKPGAELHLQGKTIVLDPGHGGRDNGTTGARGTQEKTVTIKTAQLLYSKLKAAGANVILTRSTDTYIPLSSRVGSASYHNADAFISLHYDSINDKSVRGMTVYYYHGFQKPLAESVHSSLAAQTKLKDRGVRAGDYFVIRENNKNAILLELGYLSNPAEEMLVTSPQYQEAAAAGIYQGLARYFKRY